MSGPLKIPVERALREIMKAQDATVLLEREVERLTAEVKELEEQLDSLADSHGDCSPLAATDTLPDHGATLRADVRSSALLDLAAKRAALSAKEKP